MLAISIKRKKLVLFIARCAIGAQKCSYNFRPENSLVKNALRSGQLEEKLRNEMMKLPGHRQKFKYPPPHSKTSFLALLCQRA